MIRNKRWTRNGRMGIVAILAAGATLSGAAHAQQSCGWSAAAGLDRAQGDDVLTMEVFDAGNGPTLYAGGEIFRNSQGHLAEWDATSEQWNLLPAGMGGSITALTAADGDLFVGGSFQFAGNNPANHIARWDGSGWTALGGGLSGPQLVTEVHDMVEHDGYLYVAGSFDDADGVADTQNIARWDLDSGGWSSIGSADDSVHALAVYDGELYAAGRFETIGGAAADRIARWDDVNEQWLEVGGGISQAGTTIFALFSLDGVLYVGGNYNFTDNGTTFSKIAGWDGTNWFALGDGLASDSVNALTEYHDDAGNTVLVAAGGFSQADGSVAANNIATWDGSSWSALDGGIDNFARAVATLNDDGDQTLFVGGVFETADGLASDAAARWFCPAGVVLPDPDESTVVAGHDAISSYAGETTITVTLNDANGEPLGGGRDVTINATNGAMLNTVADEGDGVYTQVLSADFSDDATITATADGVTLSDEPIVDFVPVHPEESTIELSSEQTFPDTVIDITVTPRDDVGSPVGAGFNVELETTHGDLLGSVQDNGDGTYTQSIEVNDPGTAAITATVDGMALQTAASLAVLDPDVYGDVVGINANGSPIGYFSVQDAINAAEIDNLLIVLVGPGTHNEIVLINGHSDLLIEGIGSTTPPALRGVILANSEDISVRNIDINNGLFTGVRLLGGTNANDGIEIRDSRIASTIGLGVRIHKDNQDVLLKNVEVEDNWFDGIRLDRNVSDFVLEDSVVSNNGGNGLRLRRDSAAIHLINNTISNNTANGIRIDRDVNVTIESNTITDNGVWTGWANGYGINVQRTGGPWVDPTQVTLLNNTLADNNGKPKPGRSDENVRNYDQIIDETDDQSPYTD